MTDDPRWQRMAEIAAWAARHEPKHDDGEFARRVEEYLATAEAIAADPVARAGDRKLARMVLAGFDRIVWVNAPALLAATARIARDPNVTAGERAEFADLLARALERMPAASDRRH